MWAVMNDVDWNWARILMNEINWHSAVHCENDVINLNYKVWKNLIEWKSLNAQCYNTDWTEQIVEMWMFLFERRIIVTEFMIESSSDFMTASNLTFA